MDPDYLDELMDLWNNVFLVIVAINISIRRVKSQQLRPDPLMKSNACYGNTVTIECPPEHKLHIENDFFGLSTDSEGSCFYQDSDCTVSNNWQTSLIHRFCEGQQRCTHVQGDRRLCGNDYTNYQQIEYHCVLDSEVSNMCEYTKKVSGSGYIATPNFPEDYPPNQHCSCALYSTSKIKLEATHFLIKFDQPCLDWMEIDDGSRLKRVCGAYHGDAISSFFHLTFHSDSSSSHQGAWLYYSVYPEASDATIELSCFNHMLLPTTNTTLTMVTQSSGVSTLPSTKRLTDLVQTPTPYPQVRKTTVSTTSGTSPKTGIGVVNVKLDSTTERSKKQMVNDDIVQENPVKRKNEQVTGTEDQDTGGHASNWWPNPKGKQLTGIIIICICVSGIILLVIIILVLMAYTKNRRSQQPRRHSTMSIDSHWADRHSHNLSLYDSVPLERLPSAEPRITRGSPSQPPPLPPTTPNYRSRYRFHTQDDQHGSSRGGPVWGTTQAEVLHHNVPSVGSDPTVYEATSHKGTLGQSGGWGDRSHTPGDAMVPALVSNIVKMEKIVPGPGGDGQPHGDTQIKVEEEDYTKHGGSLTLRHRPEEVCTHV